MTPNIEELVVLRERITKLEGHRNTWRRIAWRFEDALRSAAPAKHAEVELDVYGTEATADRGEIINRRASLGMRLTQLRAELPEVEKQARKTPRRDMPAERAKVEAAKARIEPLRAELARTELLFEASGVELARLGALPASALSTEATS